MSTPQISVVMPVRDAPGTLDSAIDSVLASRGVDFELICADDGSGPETAAALDAWARRDSRVRVRHLAPAGISAALNAGLEWAEAALVARMDDDDLMHPDRLREQLSFLEQHSDVALVGCRVESFREGGLLEGYRLYSDWTNQLISHDEIAREAFIDCPIPHPTWMVRREVLGGLGGYRQVDWPEDLDLLYSLLAAGHRVGKVPRVLHSWRDHDRRLSRVDSRYDRQAFSAVKAHWLGKLHPMQAAIVWGAGRTGRRMVKLLKAEGISTQAMLDINPARIGSCWNGIPILSPDILEARAGGWRNEGLRILGAVASRGARAQIRAKLSSVALVEGNDFLMVA
ncbi:MAG: glycosyltransferase [bacterium]|nr:glycosyltransferase [bacterium]